MLALVAAACLFAPGSALAAVKNWKVTGSGDNTSDLNVSGNWTASGVPANGDTAFMV